MTSVDFLRQYRVGGYAVFDFAVTFIVVILLAPVFSKIFLKIRIKIPERNWLFLALPIGIITHLLVGEITPMTEDFFNMHDHYILKLFIFILVVLGLRDVRVVKKW